MLFKELAKYIKQQIILNRPLKPLLSKWMRYKMLQQSKNQVSDILVAQFRLTEFPSQNFFMITPKCGKAAYLLKILQEYIDVMEESRIERFEQAQNRERNLQNGNKKKQKKNITN